MEDIHLLKKKKRIYEKKNKKDMAIYLGARLRQILWNTEKTQFL